MFNLLRATFMLGLSFAVSAAAGTVTHVVPLHKYQVHEPVLSTSLTETGDDIPSGGGVFPAMMYYVTVQLGTPPRDYAVGLDSGSGNLYVEGRGCTGCTRGAPNSQYDPSASSTSVPKGSFHESYETCSSKDPTADCTIQGNKYVDQVSLGGLGPVEVEVGAIQNQTTNFDTKKVVGGLMGMCGFNGKDVLATLAKSGKCDRIWGLCMFEGNQSNGTMTVGGVDLTLADEAIQYVPDAGFLIFNAVTVASISISGQQIEIGKSAILDSGTNILLLSSGIYSQAHQSMCANKSLANCQGLWSKQCFDMSEGDVNAYPPLKFQLNGVELEMSSRDYLLQGSPLALSSTQRCLGISDGGTSGFIIGQTLMRNYYVVFDQKHHQIGWGKVNVQTCGHMSVGVTATSVIV